MASSQVLDRTGPQLTSTLAQGWGLAGASLFGGAALSFLTSALLIRFADPAAYGNYASTAAGVVLGAFVLRLGLDRLATREIRSAAVDNPDDVMAVASGLLAAAAACALVGGIIIATGAAIAAPFADVEFGVLALVVTWLVAEAFRPVVVEVLRARLRLVAAAIAGPGGRALAMALTAIVLAATGRTHLEGLLFIGVVGAVIPVVVGLRAHAMSSGNTAPGALARGASLVRKDLRSISYFSLAGWSALLITSGDLLVIRWLGSSQEAASYAAAITLASAVGIVSTSVNSAVGPMSQDIVGRGEVSPGAQAAVRSLTTIAGALGLIGALVVTAIGFALPALGGDNYQSTYVLILILALGQVAGVVAGPCGTVLMLAGHERHVARVLVVTGIGAVAVEAVILATTTSLVAVAIVSAAAVLVHNVWLAASARRLVGLRTTATASIREAKEQFGVARRFRSELAVGSD